MIWGDWFSGGRETPPPEPSLPPHHCSATRLQHLAGPNEWTAGRSAGRPSSWSFAGCPGDFRRLKSQRAAAYLQSAKIPTDIPAYGGGGCSPKQSSLLQPVHAVKQLQRFQFWLHHNNDIVLNNVLSFSRVPSIYFWLTGKLASSFGNVRRSDVGLFHQYIALRHHFLCGGNIVVFLYFA